MSDRNWMDQGTKLFLGAVADLDEASFDVPTALPGWTRRHVVAHVHFNALALRRLVAWARTGVESLMYAGPDQRAHEIETGVALPIRELRRLVEGSAEDLANDLDGLTPAQWRQEVVTAQGRTVPATEVVWMRTREVAVHAVDLGTGLDFTDLPDGLDAALVADAAARRSKSGEAAALARWLTGRTTEAPVLGPWL